jgi:hypothetical protein
VQTILAAGHDGYEWATLLVALLAAVATAAAAGVALYLPRFEERRRRPRLTLSVEPERGISMILPGSSSDVIRLRLHNACRKHMARDVEVRVVAWAETAEQTDVAAEDEPLVVGNPFRGPHTTMTSVAPGHSRTIALATLDWDEHPEGGGPGGYLCTGPRRTTDRFSRMVPDRLYTIYLVVTGSNFDALFFRGVLGFAVEQEPVDGVLEDFLCLSWKEPLARVNGVPDAVSAKVWAAGRPI